MASTTSQWRIDPLKGAENYLSWSIQMLDILADMKLSGYPKGTVPMPTDAALQAAWQEND